MQKYQLKSTALSQEQDKLSHEHPSVELRRHKLDAFKQIPGVNRGSLRYVIMWAVCTDVKTVEEDIF